jgi:hypothetical protein
MVKRAVLGDLILNYSAMFPKSRVRREHIRQVGQCASLH